MENDFFTRPFAADDFLPQERARGLIGQPQLLAGELESYCKR
jgi:hypothetical protein